MRKCEDTVWTIDACERTKPLYSAPRRWGPNAFIAIQDGVTCSCARDGCNSQSWDTIFNASTVEMNRLTRDMVTQRSLGHTPYNVVTLTVNIDIATQRSAGDTSTVTMDSTRDMTVTDSDDHGARCSTENPNFIPIQIIIIIMINCGHRLWKCLRSKFKLLGPYSRTSYDTS